MNSSHRFATGLNFLDPQLTEDGKPYAPYRYKQITKEIYYINKALHATPSDVKAMTPRERSYYLEFMSEDAKRSKEAYEAMQQKKQQ